MYYLIDWDLRAGEHHPPEDHPLNPALFLVYPCQYNCGWALFRSYVLDPPESSRNLEVSSRLGGLLTCTESFPPALAIARDQVPLRHQAPQTTGRPRICTEQHCKKEFSERLANFLDAKLGAQRESGYFLARSIKRAAMLWVGDWLWIVGVNADRSRVAWVSNDFFVYSDPAECFDLPSEALEVLAASEHNVVPGPSPEDLRSRARALERVSGKT